MVWLSLLACGPDTEREAISIEILQRLGIHDLVAAPTGALPEELDWSWTVDETPSSYRTNRIPAHAIYPGQHWTVSASWPGEPDDIIATDDIDIQAAPGGNVMLVILDDIGVDKLQMYGLNPLAPPTPTLDSLAAQGVVFRRAYASSTCSPTRAEILTGRHGRRTGAGWLVDISGDTWELGLDAITLPEALDAVHGPSYSDTFLGKWHLAGRQSPNTLMHPLLQGFSSFAGTVGYLVIGTGDIDGYFSWKKNIDGVEAIQQVYNTTDIVNDGISKLDTLEEPFLLVVSFNAAHVPYHVPPAELHTRPLGDAPSDVELFAAMTEAMDTEFGRLLDHMSADLRDRTTIIVVGDNGTADLALDPGFDPARSKHTNYEGGIRVPLLVTGPHVNTPGTSDSLVHVVDLFSTIAEIAGVPLGDVGEQLALDRGEGSPQLPLDGRSLLPMLADPSAEVRSSVFVQSFRANGPPPWVTEDYALIEKDIKLIRHNNSEEFFLMPEPGGLDEGTNLLSAPLSPMFAATYLRLSRTLDEQLASMPYEGQ